MGPKRRGGCDDKTSQIRCAKKMTPPASPQQIDYVWIRRFMITKPELPLEDLLEHSPAAG
jgi:hypothetical protein